MCGDDANVDRVDSPEDVLDGHLFPEGVRALDRAESSDESRGLLENTQVALSQTDRPDHRRRACHLRTATIPNVKKRRSSSTAAGMTR